jgi:hypothetical protein
MTIMSAPATDPDVALLEQENAALARRLFTTQRALNSLSGHTVVAGVFGRGQTVDKVIGYARAYEALGFVPAIRFLRDKAGNVNGVELAILTDHSSPSLELVREADGADLGDTAA